MHSGENRRIFSAVRGPFRRSAKKVLDGVRRLCSNAVMEKYIRSVSKSKGHFGINIPRKLVLGKRWGDVSHVLIEDSDPNYITIRRLIDEKSLKE
jgi:hypothetical protein